MSRALLAVAALLAAPTALADPWFFLPGACEASASASDACVTWTRLARGEWNEVPATGGLAFTEQAPWDAYWNAANAGWPERPAAPVIPFDGGFALLVVGVDGGPLTDAQILDVASPAPGRYVVHYLATWVIDDVEVNDHPYDLVLVRAPPGEIAWVGWQTLPDGSGWL